MLRLRAVAVMLRSHAVSPWLTLELFVAGLVVADLLLQKCPYAVVSE